MTIWNNLSLRLKITILYIGLLALILSIIGMTFFIDTKNLLIMTTASDLRARAKPIIEHWIYQSKDERYYKNLNLDYLLDISKSLARDLTSRDTVALILDKNGKTIANGRRLQEEPVPPPPDSFYYSRALNGENEVTYIVSQNNYHTLVVLIPLRANPKSRTILGVVQLSSPLTMLEKTLRSHSIKLLTGIIITLIFGSILGFLITSSSLRRLKRMTVTCKKISRGNFRERVNLPHYKDEIGQLADAFDNMIDRIESTIETQKRFIANAAHELRTPLTAIRGSIEVLLRGSLDNPSAVKKLSQTIYREITRLSRLCDKLLDISRLQVYGAPNKVSISITDFFKEFISEIEILFKDRKLYYEPGPYAKIVADPDLLKQALLNLVDNAIKYTKNGDSITIGWELSVKSLKIYVKDNGIGISSEDISHIFEPFYRGKNKAAREEHGTGLGLTAVKSIVETHKGKIWVDSKPGKGSSFFIELPLE